MVHIRKIVFTRELITSDSFGEPCEPVSRVAAAAVIRNPLAGRFESDLSALFECGAELGRQLAEEAVAQLTRLRFLMARPQLLALRVIWNMAARSFTPDWARRCEPRFKAARLLFRPM